ncbi:nucleotidyltransferase family protein [Stutzerimonas stutzeri]|uniref:nucleotidyltransferase family protein n=1 Tax=Stutzerimonas stutzeri TaxID=316 RepID=UPI000F7A4E9D|nr:nucleotidyltransferase family protein [Stutzerimonas stutzeri]RRV90769.1 nucleotidyltransferase family protein [Stutzerimonas stutzeri]
MPGAGVCAIVLAAGQGSRYRAAGGADKLLAPSLSDAPAPPVLAATLANLRGVAERLLVVTRADNLPLRDWLSANAADCEVLALETRGLGHSLAQAVAQVPAARGWLVALGDMPYVQPRTLREIAAAIREDNLVVPIYDGRPGHPRGIGSGHRDALLQLDGDRGAQVLFAAHPVLDLALNDPGVLQDIDHPDDRRQA